MDIFHCRLFNIEIQLSIPLAANTKLPKTKHNSKGANSFDLYISHNDKGWNHLQSFKQSYSRHYVSATYVVRDHSFNKVQDWAEAVSFILTNFFVILTDSFHFHLKHESAAWWNGTLPRVTVSAMKNQIWNLITPNKKNKRFGNSQSKCKNTTHYFFYNSPMTLKIRPGHWIQCECVTLNRVYNHAEFQRPCCNIWETCSTIRFYSAYHHSLVVFLNWSLDQKAKCACDSIIQMCRKRWVSLVTVLDSNVWLQGWALFMHLKINT